MFMNQITLASGIMANIEKMGFSEAMLVAVAGIAVVLLELALLTVLILLLSKTMRAIEGKLSTSSIQAAAPAVSPAPVAAPAAAPVATSPAAVAAGPVLVDIDERTAAVVMAIVSNESGIPLNQLNFKSIKRVED